MISLPISTGIKCMTVFVLQLFCSCDDGLTYDENGQVITAAPVTDTMQQTLLADSISRPDTIVYHVSTDNVAKKIISTDDVAKKIISIDNVVKKDTAGIKTKSVTPDELVIFAETQLGVRYKYGSINPKVGFDCSGFITYVFSHFGIKVPRSSVDFTHIGEAVPVKEAKKGDLILFTGTNPNIRVVGHMGIVHSIDGDEIKFIHSSSGKANGVTINPLKGYYQGRFMSIRRIFPQNNFGLR